MNTGLLRSVTPCDDDHRTECAHGRNSKLSTWFGRRASALFEPGDTRQQWKGEAAASFVCAGITSSCVLPTSSADYWSLSHKNASELSEAFLSLRLLTSIKTLSAKSFFAEETLLLSSRAFLHLL